MGRDPVDQPGDTPDGESANPSARNGAGLATVGGRVRDERLRQQIGVRELARRVGVSASLISQVELGKASPSVGTLYGIVNQLGLSLDELLLEQPTPRPEADRGDAEPKGDLGDARGGSVGAGSSEAEAETDVTAGAGAEGRAAAGATAGNGSEPPSAAVSPVVRRGGGKSIQLASGVSWERLTPQTPQDVDFLHVRYEVGGASCPEDSLMRHSGNEYGHVLAGRLGVAIGFETYELGPGDSISFESTMPHRLFTIGEEPVDAIWFVVGRRGDPRIVRS